MHASYSGARELLAFNSRLAVPAKNWYKIEHTHSLVQCSTTQLFDTSAQPPPRQHRHTLHTPVKRILCQDLLEQESLRLVMHGKHSS